ncbi:Cytochrome c oxidase subunit 5A, mitochondrial [Tupaia chinensis]|uniref:Cytochrome c oxidase subunit 5A, mitochondrial n=1 Tax=Tupaia chinensis TaxID=246437 RepID=L9KY41_TUPCH|nr:Cytochrome c oxidase subunit 5A, mitochondrial [Tupaia chinensis]
MAARTCCSPANQSRPGGVGGDKGRRRKCKSTEAHLERLNDFASAVRILEVVKDKAGPHKEIYPYVIQELRPTLNELDISTPEELCLDKA